MRTDLKHHIKQSVSWRAQEYLFRHKNPTWYIKISLFFLVVCALFIYIGNWWSTGITIALFVLFLSKSQDRPKVVDITVTDTGIKIDDREIQYGEMHSFILDTDHRDPVLVFDLNYPLAMPLTVVAKKDKLDDALEIVLRSVPMRKDFSLVRWLTHWLHY